VDAHGRNIGVAVGTLLASSATLLCCVLPAVLVSLGAGATLVSLVSAFPQLVWLSERKSLVFSAAALLLLGGAVLLWRARSQPCPANAAAARACQRLRRISGVLYAAAAVLFLIGATFAYLLPALRTNS
jgi:hypothetical protein